MTQILLRLGGILIGAGAGLGWGWMSSRLFRRPLFQDLSAVFGATWAGCFAPVGVAMLIFFTNSDGGLGAASAGVSEFVLVGLPLTMLILAGTGRIARRRLGATTVPILLGGLAALIASVTVAMTIGLSLG